MATLIKQNDGTWATVGGYVSVWTGTQEQLDKALEANEIPDGTIVMVTDN